MTKDRYTQSLIERGIYKKASGLPEVAAKSDGTVNGPISPHITLAYNNIVEHDRNVKHASRAASLA